MSEFHLQARRAVDTSGPRREQTRLVDADNMDAATRIAGELAGDGYTVWIFRRTAHRGVSAVTHRLRLLRTVSPGPPIPQPDPVRTEVAALRRRQ